MIRVRHVMHICARHFNAAHHISRKATTASSPRDPSTWPKNCTGLDIENLLRDHLKDPAGIRTSLNYESIAGLHRRGDYHTVRGLLNGAFKPIAVDIETYLETYVDGKTGKAAMPLQERTPQLDELDIVLKGNRKRNVAFCYSPHGSGKTQFLKHFVYARRADAMKCGRVIVRCCDKAKEEPWFKKLLEDCSSNQSAPSVSSTTKGLCELIRAHVEAVTGNQQNESDYSDSARACDTWIRETQDHFNISPAQENMKPLIILDTCELLSNHEVIDRNPVGQESERFTLLDALCRDAWGTFGIFVIGCSAKINALPTIVKSADIKDIKALAPLGEEGHKNAVASWSVKLDEEVRVSLYHWAGGLPRLLRLAHEPHSLSLASGTLHGFSDCFNRYLELVNPKGDSSGLLEKWLPHAYTCLLASSTKAKVQGSDIIQVFEKWEDSSCKLTYDEASMLSIGTFVSSTNRFMVPPISFNDALLTGRHPRPPIDPSKLHPFLTSDVVQHFGKNSDKDRGWIFEKAFVYAVYARYLLAFWKDPLNPWVSLGKVFEGAIDDSQHDIMEQYETNLSRGVVKKVEPMKYAVTFTGGPGNAHHDAYIWCRSTKNTDNFAVPMQLRHGYEKSPSDLEKQLKKSRDSAIKVPLLLSVNQEARAVHTEHAKNIVKINADEMSSIRWLWLIAKRKEPTANASQLQ